MQGFLPGWGSPGCSQGLVVTLTFDPFQNIPKELAPVATDKYLGGTHDPVQKQDLLLDLMADGFFCVPSVNTARYHRGESLTLNRRGTLTPPASRCILS